MPTDDTNLSISAEQGGNNTDTIVLNEGVELAKTNRYQGPAYLFAGEGNDPLAPSRHDWVSGQPTYAIMADGAQCIKVLRLLVESFRRMDKGVPHIAIIGKHGKICGVGTSSVAPDEAMYRALKGDPVAVMDGNVVTNFEIDDFGAVALTGPVKKIGHSSWGLRSVFAPGFTETGVEILCDREKICLLANPALSGAAFSTQKWIYRQVGSDWLRRPALDFVLSREKIKYWAGREMNDREFKDALIAFACCWGASSPTVTLAKDGMLIGLGCGPQDLTARVRLCLDQARSAGHDPYGSVFASDEFFPHGRSQEEIGVRDLAEIFRMADDIKDTPENAREDILKKSFDFAAKIMSMDGRNGPEILIDAGCVGGIVPAGGRHHHDVDIAFTSSNRAVGFLPSEFQRIT